jgi:alkanesulfonate monooxygenase SsuD/methylene tetrahydromethanopterin reductase-like flavin-dependent oxidoreductase (luciferase family)
LGGESAPALKRVGEVGDGWFGVNVAPEDAKAKIQRMRQYAKTAGRDPEKLHIPVIASTRV